MDPRHLTLALLGVSGLIEAYYWLRLALIRVSDWLDLAYYCYEHRGQEKCSKINANWVFDLLAQPLDADSVMALDCWVDHSKEDLISTLPDEIFSFIMSSLSPREAVRTSVVKKIETYLCIFTQSEL